MFVSFYAQPCKGVKFPANLIAQSTDVPGNPVKGSTVGIPHAITSPVEVVIVEGVHSGVRAQDVDSGARTHDYELPLMIYYSNNSTDLQHI